MVLLAVAVFVGVAAGRLRPPLGLHAPRVQFRAMPLLAAGAALNLLAYVLDGGLATVTLAASLGLLIGFVVANPQVTGVAVVGVGLLVNLAAVVLNGGMPVRPGALVEAGVVEEDELATVSFRGPRHLESDGDLLPVLGDVLPRPVGGEVLSFGDLIVVLGAADAVRDLARRRRRPWSADERQAYETLATATSTAAPATLDLRARPEPAAGEPDGDRQPSRPAARRDRPLVATAPLR